MIFLKIISNTVVYFSYLDRLRSLMPFCEKIPLNKIVSIQRFRPFAVKGVKDPPYEFPRISHDKRRRQIMRLRNRTVSNEDSSKI